MDRAKLHLAPARFVALHLRKNSPARGKGKSHFLKERHKYSPNPTIYTVKQPSNLWSCESRLGQPWPHHWRCSNLGFPLNPQVQSWDRLGEETKGTMCYPCGPEARLSPVSNRPILQVKLKEGHETATHSVTYDLKRRCCCTCYCRGSSWLSLHVDRRPSSTWLVIFRPCHFLSVRIFLPSLLDVQITSSKRPL